MIIDLKQTHKQISKQVFANLIYTVFFLSLLRFFTAGVVMSSVNGPTPGATIVKVGWLQKRGILVQGLTSQRGALGFSVLWCWQYFRLVFWVFGICCDLGFLFYFALSFRFLDLLFDMVWLFPVSFQKIWASVTSTACTSSLILLTVFGFD